VSLLPLDRPLHVPRTGSSPGRPAQHHHPVSVQTNIPTTQMFLTNKTNKSSTRVIEFHSEWNFIFWNLFFSRLPCRYGWCVHRGVISVTGSMRRERETLERFLFWKGKEKRWKSPLERIRKRFDCPFVTRFLFFLRRSLDYSRAIPLLFKISTVTNHRPFHRGNDIQVITYFFLKKEKNNIHPVWLDCCGWKGHTVVCMYGVVRLHILSASSEMIIFFY
jgi:hypothetical protein